MYKKEEILSFIDCYSLKTRELKRRFYELEDRKWSIETYWMELCIQMGHFVYVTLTEDNKIILKEPNRNLDNVADEICDILYQIINVIKELGLKFTEELQCSIYCSSEAEMKELIIVMIGQMGDAILRKDGFKQKHNCLEQIENKLIIQNCFNIITLLFAYIDNHQIHIEDAFEEMIKSASEYVVKMDKMKDGYFSKIEKKEIVEKRIYFEKENIAQTLLQNQDIAFGVWEYVDRLKFNNIRIVKPMDVSVIGHELVIIQPYVPGRRLDQFISSFIRIIPMIDIIKSMYCEILNEIVLLYECDKNVRVDTNLGNFIIDYKENSYDLYYVDLYPPILIDHLANNVDNSIIIHLFIDMKVSILSLLYNYCRKILDNIVDAEKDIKSQAKLTIHDIINYTYKQLKRINYIDKIELQSSYKYFEEKIKVIHNFLDLTREEQSEKIKEIRSWSLRRELEINDIF